MQPAAHGQTAAFDPDQSPEQDQAVGHDSAATDFQAIRRFIPSSKASRMAAARGWEHSDHGLLPVLTLKPGAQHDVRLLPCFAEGEKFYLPLVHHEWPAFEHNPVRVRAACSEQTHPALLAVDQPKPCPACAAEVDVRKAALVYALVDGQPLCLKFTEKNPHVLKRLIGAGCFDLKSGRRVCLWNDNWELDFKLLKPDPIVPKHFEIALAMEVLHTRTWPVRDDLLTHMAEARKGWLKAGQVEPQPGQHERLVKLLPECTLIRIPWGMKGPQDLAWQNTPYELMLSMEYRVNLDQGNIGLLCGRDPMAVEKGLIPDFVVIGLDADEDVFAEALRQLNPWLDDTFAVEGNRGVKWFFAIHGEGVERCLRSTKIMQRGADKDREVGDWLAAGKQGVVWGLHPSGKMYIPNWKPLLKIELANFRLPRSCYLPSQQVSLPSPAEQYRKHRHRREDASTGAILDLSKLTNVHRVSKGAEAACPACRADDKDSAGDNLLIYPNGRYQCARFIKCSPAEINLHNQDIYRLAGIGGSNDEH